MVYNTRKSEIFRKEKLFLGFDIGSHSCKGVLLSESGSIVAEESVAHRILHPAPGREEQDSSLWWEHFQHIIGTLISKIDGEVERIVSIGITGFVPGLCMIDREGKSLGNTIMHTDLRGQDELKEINAVSEEEVSLGTLLPNLLWVEHQEPEVFARISKVMVPHGYLVYKLTGEVSCDYDTASIFGGVFDRHSRRWKKETLSALGISSGIMPPLASADSIAGNLSSEAAELTGLPESTPVIVGSGDSFTALIGAGASRAGDLFVYLGTSGTRIKVEVPLEDVADGPHFVPGKVNFVGRIFSCGETLERMRRLLGDRPWEELDQLAEEVEIGSEGLVVVPNLKQLEMEEDQLAGRDSFVGYGDAHEPGHLFRAAMEGIALFAKEGAEGEAERAERIIVSGGPLKSRPMRRILAGVFGGKVYAEEKGHSGVGAAVLSGYGTGYLTTLSRDSLESLTIEASEEEVNSYAPLKPRFSKIRKRLHEMD